MNRWRRLLFYLFLNVLVSACTTTLVLMLWGRYNLFSFATPSPVPIVGTIITLTPEPTDTPSPSPTPTLVLSVYEVQPGETLGSIALAFDVSVEDLMRLNGLTDPNALGSGETLLIPVTPEPTVAPTETPSPPGTTTVSTAEAALEIITIVGAGVLQDERVDIRLSGAEELSLAGWQLEDRQGNAYVFPQLTLFSGGSVSVYSRAGVDNALELYWGRAEAVWSTGDTAILRDPQGNIRATYQVP